MARSTVPLTQAKVDKLVRTGAPAKIADGRSLYLVIRSPGVGFWKGQWDGSRRTKGLGPAADVKLADARADWEQFKAGLRDGTIPMPASPGRMPRSGSVVPTGMPFADAVADYVTAKADEWRGGATGKYARLFAADAKAVMPDGRVLGTLTWPELGDDVIAAYVANMNPRLAKDTTVRLRSIRNYQQNGKLPPKAPKVEHYNAMPYKDTPEFYSILMAAAHDVRARALAFVILTGVRIGDVLGTGEKAPATWAEINGDVWMIPGSRTKTGEPHSVPLTPAMLALIGDRREGHPLFDTGYFKVHRYLKNLPNGGAVIHGFRASFRSWMMDQGFDREAAELCLQHTIGDKSEQAYKRSDILARRRTIMEKWGEFLASTMTSETPAPVA